MKMRNQSIHGKWTALVLSVMTIAVFSAYPANAADDDRGQASVTIGGKKIVIDYGRPSTEGKGYQSLQKGMAEGFFWRMGKDKATTLETEADLKFGDQDVKAGKYSLVAKKTKDGWEMLVHPKADRWGTPVPKEGYLATIPLKTDEPKEEAKLLTIQLEEKEGAGLFALTWGKDQLTTEFKIAD